MIKSLEEIYASRNDETAMDAKNRGTNVSCTVYVAPRLQVGALGAVAAASLSRRSLRLWV